MKISGNCYIAKKYKQSEKDFEKRGSIGTGKLIWMDKIKDSDGKVYNSYTKKSFVCFGANIEYMYSCRNNLLEIEGQLRTEKYIKDGQEYKIEKVYISKVEIAKIGEEFVKKDENGVPFVEDYES